MQWSRVALRIRAADLFQRRTKRQALREPADQDLRRYGAPQRRADTIRHVRTPPDALWGCRRWSSARTVCGDPEHPRNDPITDLDHPFHLERRAHESHEVVGEGYMAGSDSTADAGTELV
jgi:hypothetical protein